MPRLQDKFRAFADLLERGTTDQLSRDVGPPLRGLKLVPPTAAPVLFPTAEELTDGALGQRPRPRREKQVVPLRVSVAHGSFEYARFPVAVGHYFGDVIVGSEAFLDRKLGGGLTQRYGLQLYPDDLGSAEVILAPGRQPPGGIVIGLGQVGELTPEVLSRGVVRAALRHALAVLHADPPAAGDLRRRSAAFSSVLIGTNSGRGLSIESAIRGHGARRAACQPDVARPGAGRPCRHRRDRVHRTLRRRRHARGADRARPDERIPDLPVGRWRGTGFVRPPAASRGGAPAARPSPIRVAGGVESRSRGWPAQRRMPRAVSSLFC